MAATPPPPKPPAAAAAKSSGVTPRVGKRKQAAPTFLRRAFLSPCAALFVSPAVSAERRMKQMERIIEEAEAQQQEETSAPEPEKKPN